MTRNTPIYLRRRQRAILASIRRFGCGLQNGYLGWQSVEKVNGTDEVEERTTSLLRVRVSAVLDLAGRLSARPSGID